MSDIKLPKGKACISVLKNKKTGKDLTPTMFHKASLRLVPIPGPKNTKATILIGCPKSSERAWLPKKKKKITDRQGRERVIIGACEFKSGPKKGSGATRGYMKIQQPRAGRCRSGYKLKAFTIGGKKARGATAKKGKK